jgi:hypothetical protein
MPTIGANIGNASVRPIFALATHNDEIFSMFYGTFAAVDEGIGGHVDREVY